MKMGMVLKKIRKKTKDENDEGSIDAAYQIPSYLKQRLMDVNFTDVEIKEVRDAFQLYDKNKRGIISRKSFLFVLRCLGQNPTEDEVEDMLNIVDADRNGLIEYSEFLELIATVTEKMDETLQALFLTFDHKGRGSLSMDHLKELLMIGGSGLTEKDIDDMFSFFHTDGKGNVVMEDFTNVMKLLPKLGQDPPPPRTRKVNIVPVLASDIVVDSVT